MIRLKWILILALAPNLSVVTAQAAPPKIPQKFLDAQLQKPAPQEWRFSSQLVDTREFVHVKKREWEACHQNPVHEKLQPFAAGDRLEPIQDFVEAPLLSRDPQVLESHGLTHGEVALTPWSGDFWPYAYGILGARYMDPKFSALPAWLSRFEFIQKHPVSDVLRQHGQDGLRTLSPAEKYDLLVGDPRQSLASSMWAQGKQYYDQDGKVEEWMGICHGWAPAAIAEPRPVKSIAVLSQDRQWQITLNPSEIKGLASYSWATNPYASAFLGRRCNEKNPARGAHGRITAPECFDLNPATWHLAVVHLVGQQKRSFVLDATFDYEVWNQPIVGYSYRYFNPQTGRSESSFAKSVVQRENFTKDPYAKYRSSEARSFVGILMKVGYVIETTAVEDDSDSPENDSIRWVQYRYDLELNAQGEAIGGEWYTESHPDFIWVPRKGARPASRVDAGLREHDMRDAVVPEAWVRAAHSMSSQGVILHTLTEALLKMAAE